MPQCATQNAQDCTILMLRIEMDVSQLVGPRSCAWCLSLFLAFFALFVLGDQKIHQQQSLNIESQSKREVGGSEIGFLMAIWDNDARHMNPKYLPRPWRGLEGEGCLSYTRITRREIIYTPNLRNILSDRRP